MRNRTLSRRAVLAGASATILPNTVLAEEAPLVFAAASLKSVLEEVFGDLPNRISYAGSGVLARQIAHGAPADLFISANPEWMAQIAPKAVPGTVRDLLGNGLVLVGNGADTLDTLPPDARIATGLTAAVPLGQYVKASLEALGTWDSIAPRLVEVENAQHAVTLVARGDVAFGLIYKSDAQANGLEIRQELPQSSHPPIRYPAALLSERGRQLYDILFSDAARDVFEAQGFEVLF